MAACPALRLSLHKSVKPAQVAKRDASAAAKPVGTRKSLAKAPLRHSQLVVGLLLVLLGTAAHATTAAAAVVLGDDGGADALHLLVLLLDLLGIGLGVGVHPGLALLERLHDLLLLLLLHLAEALVVAGALRGGAHGVPVAVEGVLRAHA